MERATKSTIIERAPFHLFVQWDGRTANGIMDSHHATRRGIKGSGQEEKEEEDEDEDEGRRGEIGRDVPNLLNLGQSKSARGTVVVRSRSFG